MSMAALLPARQIGMTLIEFLFVDNPVTWLMLFFVLLGPLDG